MLVLLPATVGCGVVRYYSGGSSVGSGCGGSVILLVIIVVKDYGIVVKEVVGILGQIAVIRVGEASATTKVVALRIFVDRVAQRRVGF